MTVRRLVRPSLDNAWFVTLLYLAIAVAMTWPLSSVLTTKIAWDMGDPVFICWVLMWTGGQVIRFLSGDWSALADYWNGNIFYPEKLTVAYSEHFAPMMLQILPIYAATGNIILCYNLLFLSALVLSGLGMYLLVRELTGNSLGAFVAGVAFAWSPYRVDQFPHLQVMSSQWMPLALYGLRRYFVGGQLRALVGGVSAVVIQVLSCTYYLFYFTPVVAAYCLYEIATRRLWRNRKMWMQLGAAAVVALLVIAPFIVPYMKVREINGIGVREIDEVRSFSADTWGLFTSSENITLLGQRLVARVKAEGNGFPGFTILLLGLIGIGATVRGAVRQSRSAAETPSTGRRIAGAIFIVTGGVLFTFWVWLLVFGGGTIHVAGMRGSTRDLATMSARTAVWLALTLWLLPRTRRFFTGVSGSMAGFLVATWVISVALAWGPMVTADGHSIGAGPYLLLYKYIPGFNGMRVPGRFLMISTLAIAALAGIGFAALTEGRRKIGYALSVVVLGGMLAESAVVPFILNKALWVDHFSLQPAKLRTAGNLGDVYEAIRVLPQNTVLVEFPFGTAPYDTQAVYYAGYHRKALLNGYSGFFPASYKKNTETLAWDPTENRDAAWKTLMTSGATHVVVHEAAYLDNKGEGISRWLRSSGAHELAAEGTDRLFALK